jgi:O-antigen/teichoic acid export membrane protein
MIKESLINIVDRGFKAVFSLVFLVLLGNYASTEVFGLMMLMLVYRQISLVVSSLGSDNYVLQKIVTADSLESKLNCFLEHFFIRAGLVVVVSVVVATLGKENQLIIILSGGLLALSSLIESFNRAKSQVHYNVIAYTFALCLLSYFYYKVIILGSLSFDDACYLLFFESLISFITLFSYFIYRNVGRFKLSYRMFEFDFKMPHILISLCFSAVVAILQSRVDILILEKFGSLAEVAELGLAARLTALLFIPLVAFNTVLIVKANKINLNEIGSSIFYKSNQLAVIFVYILIAISCVAIYFLFPFVFGDKYSNAVNIFFIYVLTLIPSSMLHLQTVWYYQEKLIMFALYKNIATLLLAVLCLYFVVPSNGAYGAAWIMVLSGFFNAYIFNLFNKKARLILKRSYRCLFLHNINYLKKVT